MNSHLQIIIITILVVGVVFYVLWTRFTRRVVVWEYQTALHYRNGLFVNQLPAGAHRLWGRGHSLVLYDERVMELVVPSQELMTADSATVKLSAVAQYRITEARRYHEAAEDARQVLYTQIQLALREVLGSLDLDAILAEKAGFSRALLETAKAGPVMEMLGIEIQKVVIRDLMLGGELKAACAAVLTARKEAQAKQEQVRGEAAALRTLANAARVFENNPELLRLRALDTLKELGAGYNNTLYIGLPDEMLQLAAAMPKK